MDQSKAEFLEQFGGDYGYPDAPRGIDELRAAEFKRLEGVISRPSQFIRENYELNLSALVKMKDKSFLMFVPFSQSFIGNFSFVVVAKRGAMSIFHLSFTF
jgi:hypothetical protein